MHVYRGLEAFERLPSAVVTTGTFDGVHIGHQKILARLKEIATTLQGETVLITFWPHPRMVLQNEKKNLALLSTIDEKIDILRAEGIDHLVILPFTEVFAQMSPEEYVQNIYIQAIGTKYLVIGYDHRFGKNREGGLEYLLENTAKFGFQVEEIPRQDIDEVGVSSTKIRNALQEGNIKIANQYLGRPYGLSGKVVHGDKIGRTIGFPTANLAILDDSKLIPSDGIYAVKCMVKSLIHNGMLYIGNRPTLDNQLQKRIEVNILDFDADIYGENITLQLMEKIREDQKFESLNEMHAQLQQDRKNTEKILAIF